MMKKFILGLCLLALSTGSAIAQSFTLTSNGFVDEKNTDKSFVVVEVAGTQAELYNKTKAYLTSIYTSPKDVLSEAAPDLITVNGIQKDAVQKKAMGMAAVSYDMNYTLTIRFKDGKIRVDAPSFTLADYTTNASKPIKMVLCGKSNGGFGSEVINAIYNKKGELKAKYAKEALEAFFNGYVAKLAKGINNTEKEDS